jgi:3-methyladenine DNA glycosylase/8-oxoguanine DNA glycosylase
VTESERPFAREAASFGVSARGVSAPDVPPDAAAEIPVDAPLDLRRTLVLHGRGAGDPTLRMAADGRVFRATRTPAGPATLLLERLPGGDGVRASAWGPGADRALAGVPALIGLEDQPGLLVPRHRAIADAVRRLPGLRIGRTGSVLEALVPAILEQKVTGDEARRTFRALVLRYGDPAPGPGGLRVQPAPAVLAALPYHAFHPLGLERRRADLIRSIAREASRLEATVALSPDRAYAVLRSFPGIGPWTAAEVGLRAYGDPDALSVGDFHLPNLVAWALAGEPRGTDERMLELLEPYRGQRGRVARLLELGGIRAPRYGPRMPTRHIETL